MRNPHSDEVNLLLKETLDRLKAMGMDDSEAGSVMAAFGLGWVRLNMGLDYVDRLLAACRRDWSWLQRNEDLLESLRKDATMQ